MHNNVVRRLANAQTNKQLLEMQTEERETHTKKHTQLTETNMQSIYIYAVCCHNVSMSLCFIEVNTIHLNLLDMLLYSTVLDF